MALLVPPDLPDTLPRAVEDAVIQQARRRARRRRITQGVVVALIFAAVVALLRSRDASPPPAAGAPNAGQVAGSGLAAADGDSLVMKWGEIHVGWALVYADGRVLWRPDSPPVLERRLTATGLAFVKSGAVAWDKFMDDSHSQIPAGAWLDPGAREYRPAAHAVCLYAGQNQPTTDVRALPASARAVLTGAPRAPAGHVLAASYSNSMWNCLRVTDGELEALRRTAAAGGESTEDEDFTFPPSANGTTVEAFSSPIMPHGEWIAWGG